MGASCVFVPRARAKSIPFTLGNDPSPEAVSQLSQEVYTQDLLQRLIDHIHLFEFEVGGLCAGARWAWYG